MKGITAITETSLAGGHGTRRTGRAHPFWRWRRPSRPAPALLPGSPRVSALARVIASAGLPILLACGGAAANAEDFHRLSGAQLTMRFVGHMLTDDTHWRETYQPGGKLIAEQIGGSQMLGSWRVKGDNLCSVLPGVRDDCYAVWMAGDQVELRHPSYQPVGAFLRPSRPTSR